MNQKNIFAFTPADAGSYPPYVSLNECDGELVLTMRGYSGGGSVASTDKVVITVDDLRKMADGLNAYLAAAPQPSDNLQQASTDKLQSYLDSSQKLDAATDNFYGQASTAQAGCGCAQGQCCQVCDPDVCDVAASATDAGQRGQRIELRVDGEWVPARFIATDLVGGEPIVQRDGAMPVFATWNEVRGIDRATPAQATPEGADLPREVESRECAEQQSWWEDWKAANPINAKHSPANAALEAWIARAKIAATTAAEPVDANRLAMWLSASMDQHSRAGEMCKHIQAWLDLNRAALPEQVDESGLPG